MLPSMLVQAALILSALPAHARSDGRTMHTLVASSVINLDDALDRNGTSSEAFGYSIQGYAAPEGRVQVGGTTYTWGEKLGKGSSATVYKLKRSFFGVIGKTFVGKLFQYVSDEGASRQLIRDEIELQKLCEGNKHIVEIIDDEKIKHGDTVIVMEYLNAGDLNEMITNNQRQIQRSGLPGVKDIFKQIVEGVMHMHSKGVAHRDLKPHNIFLAGAKAQVVAKIGDFGLAEKFEDIVGNKIGMAGAVGTTRYMSPEIIMSSEMYSQGMPNIEQNAVVLNSTGRSWGNAYGPEVDVWALGVTLYNMLTGTTPWCNRGRFNKGECYSEILLNPGPRDDSYPDCVTPGAKDLIEKMLQKNVANRITIDEILQHAAMKEEGQLVKSSTDTVASLLQVFKKFAMKGAGLVMPSPVTSRRNLRGAKAYRRLSVRTRLE